MKHIKVNTELELVKVANSVTQEIINQHRIQQECFERLQGAGKLKNRAVKLKYCLISTILAQKHR